MSHCVLNTSLHELWSSATVVLSSGLQARAKHSVARTRCGHKELLQWVSLCPLCSCGSQKGLQSIFLLLLPLRKLFGSPPTELLHSLHT